MSSRLVLVSTLSHARMLSHTRFLEVVLIERAFNVGAPARECPPLKDQALAHRTTNAGFSERQDVPPDLRFLSRRNSKPAPTAMIIRIPPVTTSGAG